jgi:hypothetical protein
VLTVIVLGALDVTADLLRLIQTIVET